MDSSRILYYAVFVLLFMMTIKNFKQMKASGNDRKFVDVYTKILNEADDSESSLDDFLSNESSPYLLNKGKLLKAYVDLKKGSFVDISDIDFRSLFYINGKADKMLFNRNSDLFIWITLLMSRAKKYSNDKLIQDLITKTKETALTDCVEYQLCLASGALLSDKEETEYAFLKELLDGNYGGLKYEKRLIGLYKREAAAFLSYKNIEVDEFWLEDLCNFSRTVVGRCFMSDLDLLERFPPNLSQEDKALVEELEEENTEDKENTQE